MPRHGFQLASAILEAYRKVGRRMIWKLVDGWTPAPFDTLLDVQLHAVRNGWGVEIMADGDLAVTVGGKTIIYRSKPLADRKLCELFGIDANEGELIVAAFVKQHPAIMEAMAAEFYR